MLYSSSPCPNYNQQAALWLDGKALTGIQFVTVTGVESRGWGRCSIELTVKIELSECVRFKVSLDKISGGHVSDDMAIFAFQALREDMPLHGH